MAGRIKAVLKEKKKQESCYVPDTNIATKQCCKTPIPGSVECAMCRLHKNALGIRD